MLRERTMSFVGFLPSDAPWQPTIKLLPEGKTDRRREERWRQKWERKGQTGEESGEGV